LIIVFFQPVSERGRPGVEELEGQTVKLLSLQPIPQEVFDCQVAFNLLDRWGEASHESLADASASIRQEVQGYLAGRAPVPAMTLVQAPVFYGHAFAAYAEFAGAQDAAALASRLEAVGFGVANAREPGPSNVAVAGEGKAIITRAVPDAGVPKGCWFWGAADNLRLATANATQIAEKLLVS
jgi:aspartate-semialdehyde dehydrogenase